MMSFTAHQVEMHNRRMANRCPEHVRRMPTCPTCARISEDLKAQIGFGSEKQYENNSDREISNAVIKCDEATTLDGTAQGEIPSVGRVRVRFVGYRVRPLDPDNFAGSCKDCIDFLRHAQLIVGDEPWRITLETEQVRVSSFTQERTEIEIDG